MEKSVNPTIPYLKDPNGLFHVKWIMISKIAKVHFIVI